MSAKQAMVLIVGIILIFLEFHVTGDTAILWGVVSPASNNAGGTPSKKKVAKPPAKGPNPHGQVQ